MKLRPIVQALPPVPVRLKLPGEVHATLTRYAEYYRDEHGAGIEVPALVVEMVRTFLASDRAFRGWQRNGEGKAGPAAGGSEERAG
jgi:hypothetical protein